MIWTRTDNGNYVSGERTIYMVKDDYGFRQPNVWSWVSNNNGRASFSSTFFKSAEEAMRDIGENQC